MKYARLLLLAGLVACTSEGGADDDPMNSADGATSSMADSSPAGSADATSSSAADASTGPASDAAVTGGEAGAVNCASATCDLTTGNICCISISGSQCTPAADCGGGFSAPQHCDGPEDCDGGDACCAVFMLGGEIGSFCRDTCSTNAEGNEAELCHIDSDCSDGSESCKVCQFTGAPMPQNACAGGDIPACNP